ncbi:MAG TPA: hypothetical protein VGK58_08960 [Lacipirellulaceae bacterium]
MGGPDCVIEARSNDKRVSSDGSATGWDVCWMRGHVLDIWCRIDGMNVAHFGRTDA